MNVHRIEPIPWKSICSGLWKAHAVTEILRQLIKNKETENYESVVPKAAF